MNFDLPLVSIIIPVYNCEVYLAGCIQSVVAQTYQNLEIIIVNDGSTDHSAAIIEEYSQKDTRIRCINKENEGLPLARKSGIEVAKGKYIQHLDGDDFLFEYAIECLVAKAEETHADIVAAPFVFCYENGTEVPSMPLNFEELSGVDYYKRILEKKAYWNVWANFQKRSLYLDYAIETVPNISFGEDAILMTQLILYASKVVSIGQPVINYNRYSSSMSHPDAINDWKFFQFRYFATWIEVYSKTKGYYSELRKEFAVWHSRVAFDSIYWNQFAYVHEDMKRLLEDFKAFPCLKKKLTRRKRKILLAYQISNFLGDKVLNFYLKKNGL